MVFNFDFGATQLSSRSRQQLANIAKAIKPGSAAAQARSALLRLIETHHFDQRKGFYIPLADDVRLKGKLPIYSQHLATSGFPAASFPQPYFTNALVLPAGWGSEGFDADQVPEPKRRATNIGFQVVTIEYDCPTIAELEECLAWTRGGDGEFNRSRFAAVDRELTRFKEYRGYTIVFTGNRSLHFHLILATKQLGHAPWNCSAEERLRHAPSHSDLLHQAHGIYWDTATSIFDSVLQPPLVPDRSTRTLTQWRRSP